MHPMFIPKGYFRSQLPTTVRQLLGNTHWRMPTTVSRRTLVTTVTIFLIQEGSPSQVVVCPLSHRLMIFAYCVGLRLHIAYCVGLRQVKFASMIIDIIYYTCLRVVSGVDAAAIIGPSSLLAASRVLIRIGTDIGQTPGTLLHSHLMRLKTGRLGRFLKKT